MKLRRLDRKEAAALLESRGLTYDVDQNGVKRIVVGDLVIEGDNKYTSLDLYVPAPPPTVTKYRLYAVDARPVPVPGGLVALGEFDLEVDAEAYADKIGLREAFRKVTEVDVPEVSQ